MLSIRYLHIALKSCQSWQCLLHSALTVLYPRKSLYWDWMMRYFSLRPVACWPSVKALSFWWYRTVIPAAREADARGSQVLGHPGQLSCCLGIKMKMMTGKTVRWALLGLKKVPSDCMSQNLYLVIWHETYPGFRDI